MIIEEYESARWRIDSNRLSTNEVFDSHVTITLVKSISA